ncbi:MAG: hypothetical protein M1830_004977 [Pleopsidium flavum]|nr:MAG: hypothetical protein M1830_004977 [Pleopsidium flavum]
MDFCNKLDFNSTIPNTDLQYGQVVGGPIYNLTGSSYLRPDIGGALLPWIYTAIVIVIHIPTVIIRVQRWETVQTWCLAATFLTVVLYSQAYVSTGFAADQVLTWTPLLLVIDAGSMLQVFVLVVEAGSLITRSKTEVAAVQLNLKRRYTKLKSRIHSIHLRRRSQPRCSATSEVEVKYRADEEIVQAAATTIAILNHDSPVEAKQSSHILPEIHYDVAHSDILPRSPQIPTQAETGFVTSLSNQEHKAVGPLKKDRAFWVAIGSLTLFIAIFILQILGLQAAAKENEGEIPSVSWCSPIFQPFGVAVMDGDCHVYPVHQTFNKGMGCIHIPGVQQMSWIKATLIVTSMTLIMEAIDLLILILVNSDSRWAEVKMRRPWCTIFGGMAVLGVTLLYGIRYSYELPPGITERVIVVMDVHKDISLYAGTLETAGLRGAIIGWNDGLFSGWGTTYFGSWKP